MAPRNREPDPRTQGPNPKARDAKDLRPTNPGPRETPGGVPGMHPRIRGAQDSKTRLRTLTDKDLGTGETQAPQNRGTLWPLPSVGDKTRPRSDPTEACRVGYGEARYAVCRQGVACHLSWPQG